jgi:hypothetical protein
MEPRPVAAVQEPRPAAAPPASSRQVAAVQEPRQVASVQEPRPAAAPPPSRNTASILPTDAGSFLVQNAYLDFHLDYDHC